MVDDFLRKAKDLIGGNNDQDAESRDRKVRPASEDPYGDPGDQAYGNVIPASQDTYGDPANNDGQYGDVRPASEDPYGDPADQVS